MEPLEGSSTESFYIESDYEYLPGLFGSLNDVLAENKAYYVNNCGGKRADDFSQCLERLLEITTKTLMLLLEVAAVSSLFDYDINIKGNGYRSIVRVVEMCFRRLHALGKDFQDNRERLFFRSDHYYNELISYLELSKGLFKFLEFAQLLLRWSTGSDLFPPEDCCDATTMTEIHLQEMEKECFYGRRLGFHVSMFYLWYQTLSNEYTRICAVYNQQVSYLRKIIHNLSNTAIEGIVTSSRQSGD